MITFAAGAATFAIAGLVAAIAPVVLHLFQHHRYQTVDWAAMDFLREALRQSRRARLRDILLLILRMACVALFGFAMARPFLASGAHEPIGNQAVHAVLLIDNSLSMSYEQLGSTLLDHARAQARQYVERLPAGSRVTVLPICATEGTFSHDAYARGEDAIDALEAIAPADREANIIAAAEMALEACRHVSEPRGKRVVLFSDVQAIDWPADVAAEALDALESVQVVQIGPRRRDNAWIAELRAADAVVSLQASTELVATVRYEGAAPRRDVELTFSVDDVVVDSRTVDLDPGQTREVAVTHRFSSPVELGGVTFSTVRVSLAADRLTDDDSRTLVVPVVEALPIVFVDQWGDDEDHAIGRYGETFRLRRLLQSTAAPDAQGHGLVHARHLRIDELSREALANARVLVIAGVESPRNTVELLRAYVEHGGQLVIAAGAQFDPRLWNELAWRDGKGILPAPLGDALVGSRPTEANLKLDPFYLDPASLHHPYFQLAGISAQRLADLYREPWFFQAAAVDESADTLRELDPAPQVIARFSNGLPFMVERRIGRGRTLFISSAIQSDWNTLTMTNAVLMFDRILRAAIEASLPPRNFGALESQVLPVDAFDRQHRYSLIRPGGTAEPLAVEAMEFDDARDLSYGVRLADLSRRGLYRVLVERGDSPAQAVKLGEIALAVNGPERESQLQSLDEAQWREHLAVERSGWIADGDVVPLEGPGFYAPNLWKWLMASVLVGLFVESGILALPAMRRERR